MFLSIPSRVDLRMCSLPECNFREVPIIVADAVVAVVAVVVAAVMMTVRTLGTQTDGIVIAILFGNMITPIINRIVKRSNTKTLVKTSLFLVLVIALATFSLAYFL